MAAYKATSMPCFSTRHFKHLAVYADSIVVRRSSVVSPGYSAFQAGKPLLKRHNGTTVNLKHSYDMPPMPLSASILDRKAYS
jgi:hypothetical protein